MSNLLTSSLDALTPVGQHFQTEVNSRVGYVNLLPGTVNGFARPINTPGGTGTALLSVDVLNNGSISLLTPVTVTFYADSGLLQPIGAVTIGAGVAGCTSRSTRVFANWVGLPVGTHPFWVKVDSLNAVIEADENDNVATGTVTVNQYGTYLPVVQRQ